MSSVGKSSQVCLFLCFADDHSCHLFHCLHVLRLGLLDWKQRDGIQQGRLSCYGTQRSYSGGEGTKETGKDRLEVDRTSSSSKSIVRFI